MNATYLTHWGRVTHICISKLAIIGSDNGLSPGRRQAIIWTNAGILLIQTLGTNFSEILGKIHWFSFKKMHSKMSSAKGRLSSLGLNELTANDIYWYMFFVSPIKIMICLSYKIIITTAVGLVMAVTQQYNTEFAHKM